MRAFARVVEVGSFTRAADVLDLPKATLTKLIQDLRRICAPSFCIARHADSNVTPDGAAYYDSSRPPAQISTNSTAA